MNRYHINIFWSDQDDSWVANVPDLEFCSAFGDTPEEAVAEIKIAIELWLEGAQELGTPIPEPRYKPALAGHTPPPVTIPSGSPEIRK